jgi:ATP-dependent Clp protease ATP-binding subunit ClpA
VSDAINRTFPPEFRNRLDAQVAFGGLTEETVLRVVDKFVLELAGQLGARDVTLAVTPALRTHLGALGYKPEFGAREMGRVIAENIKKPLADELLFGRLSKGGHVEADLVDGTVVFRYTSAESDGPTKDPRPDPADAAAR